MGTRKEYLEKKSVLCTIGLIMLLCCTVFSLRIFAAEEIVMPQPTSAKLYMEMTDNSNIIANLIVGNEFEIVSEQLDDNGSRWYKVRTDFGAEGYAKASELDVLIINAHELMYSAAIESANAAQMPENNPGEGDAAPEGELGDVSVPDSDNAEAPGGAQADGQQTPDAEKAGEAQTPNGAQADGQQAGEEQMPDGQQAPDAEQAGGEQNPDGAQADGQQTPDAEQAGEQTIPEEDNAQGEEPASNSSTADQEDKTTLASGVGFGEVENTDSTVDQDGFTVIERTDQPKEQIHGRIDAVLIMILAGGILCIIAIAALLKKILICMRMEA